MHPTECTFTASGFRREEFDHFMSIARELGIKVDCAVSSSGKTATVHVSDMPDVQDAETMRTRRAGRPSKGVVLPHDSIFNNETTCAEYLAWQQNHSVEEGMRQLGLKRTTYFRRLNSIKKAVEEIFGVKVDKVNTIRMQGKEKRQGNAPAGRRPNWKKAMVKLTADSKTIEFFEGMV